MSLVAAKSLQDKAKSVDRNATCPCGSGREYKKCCLPGHDSRTVQMLTKEKVSIQGEISYIVRRAMGHDARIVTLGQLLFFSTDTGDAWMLDPQDHLACRLARDGSPLPVRIAETSENFSIKWSGEFQVNGKAFIFSDRQGRCTISIGYPTDKILHAIGQMQ